MTIVEILLFLINLMIISSNVVPQDSTSQSVINGNLNKFKRDCPDLWKIIQDRGLAKWNTCQNKSTMNGKINEEDVLEFACFLSQKMLIFICDQKLNITNEYLSASGSTKICPFEFTQLVDLELNNSLAKELTLESHCYKICYGLYYTRDQCVVLHKLNNLLKSNVLQQTRIGLVLPDVAKTIEINTPTLREDDKTSTQKIKETTVKAKTETTSNKNATSPTKAQVTENKELESKIPEPEKPIISSTKTTGKKPNQTWKPEETKPDFKITEEENRELKNNEEDALTDDTMEEDLDTPNGPVKMDEGNHLTDVQGSVLEEGEREKLQMSFNRKEINSGDGFFQAEDSHFFFYFIVVSSIIVIGYIGFHNKNKILAYAVEGTSGRRSRRRPNPARYRKLETNLEEAISSNASEAVASSVVY